MLVVCDTSPISAMITVGRAGVLAELFGEVIIPQAVFDELAAFHPAIPSWAKVVAVRDITKVGLFSDVLDKGESEAIVLALELGADFLSMDEKAGREVAADAGLKVIGLLGVALRAKQADILGCPVRQLLAELESLAGFRISQELKRRLITLAGEE